MINKYIVESKNIVEAIDYLELFTTKMELLKTIHSNYDYEACINKHTVRPLTGKVWHVELTVIKNEN